MEIKNIYCIGRNYKNHALELGNDVPNFPMVFSKPTHALVKADESVIQFPDIKGNIHHELEIVLYIGNEVKDDFKVDDVVTKMALGIDFTLRDVQTELKKKGHPWLLAKGFKNSAVITEFWDFPGVTKCKEVDFSLLCNEETVQQGNISSVIFDFQTILEYISREFGLSKGDIIYTGTPEGVSAISDKEEYILKWGNEVKGSFTVSK